MLKVFVYWDKGLQNMPPFIKRIYEHNKNMSIKYNFELVLLSDNNIKNYIDIPERYFSVAVNFKSDIVRWFLLDKYGGIYLDTDVIITKDLNLLYDKLNNLNNIHGILDVEYGTKIGCCTLIMKPNTEFSHACVNMVNDTLNKKKNLDWIDIGPHVATEMYKLFKSNLILNSYDIVKNGCNFICWNENPGFNKKSWYMDDKEIAKKKAKQIMENSDCFYIITWTIYRKNDEPKNIVSKTFDDEKSVFYYFMHDLVN